jgi:restriction endonuclease S subunit
MKETVQPMYLRHYINSPVGRPYVLQLAQGAIQKNISGTRLGELLIPLPTRAEQEEISSAVRSFDQRLVLHRHKLRAKRDLFSTLIHELMTTKSHLNLYTINGHS